MSSECARRRGRGCSRSAGGRRAWLARRRHRQRFGIETSYRQKNQAGGWTTSTDPAYRLRLEGVALVLRQVWAVLAWAVAAARRLRPTDAPPDWTVAGVLDWLTHHLHALYPPARRIPTPPPVTTRNTH